MARFIPRISIHLNIGYAALLSFLLLALFVNKANALKTENFKWIFQSVNDVGKTLGTHVVGDNAINIFIVSDLEQASWDELMAYAQKESAYFLAKVSRSYAYNIIVVQADDLNFFVEDQTGYPSRTIRPLITSLINRSYGDDDFLVYINGFDSVGNFVTSGYKEYDAKLFNNDDLDWSYITTSLNTSLEFGVAHEAGHLIGNLADENFALMQGRESQLNRLVGGDIKEINLVGYREFISTGEIVNGEIVNVNIVDIPKDKIPWSAFIDDGVPLPTDQIESEQFGEIFYLPKQEFNMGKVVGLFGISHILFAPTSGACIMNNPDERWGYCKVCEHAWTVQALVRTREVNLSSEPGNLNPNSGLSIALTNTGDTRSVYWLVNGVTDSNLSQKTNWTSSELQGVKGKSLTMWVVNETAKGFLIDNPYNSEHSNIGGHPVRPAKDTDLVDIYSEDYVYHVEPESIPTPEPPQPTPTYTATPTNTMTPAMTNTPTPRPSIGKVEVLVLPSGEVSVRWDWTGATPSHWEIHRYRGAEFMDRVVPPPPGEVRTAILPAITTAGEYVVLVAPYFENAPLIGSDFKASVPYTVLPIPTPTPIPIETYVHSWMLH